MARAHRGTTGMGCRSVSTGVGITRDVESQMNVGGVVGVATNERVVQVRSNACKQVGV